MMEQNCADSKYKQFNHAMDKYLTYSAYKGFEKLTSFLIISLQVISLAHLLYLYEPKPFISILFTLFAAFVAADICSGVVHMIMDNNTHYTSLIGPYVAAFHLHHAKYFYQVRPALKVYYDESGTKFWLLVYMIFLTIVQCSVDLNVLLNLGLVGFSLFSSLAELSHYWCHNATDENTFVLWLQNHGVLLSKEHHKTHHCSDNVQYAFLNGISDSLIDVIARTFYKGYKKHADQHTKVYMQGLNS